MEKNNPPTLFKQHHSAHIRTILFIILATILMIIDQRSSRLTPLRTAMSACLRPLHHFFLAPREGLSWIKKHFSSIASLRQKVDDLESSNLKLNVAAMHRAHLENENAQLRHLLSLRKHLPLTTIPVEVLYDFQARNLRKVMVDHGSKHGIIIGSPVITKDGLVGQITRVYLAQSEVTLITDRSSSIPIENLRTGIRAILQGGSSAFHCEVLYQLSSTDIVAGDKLVTSGLDQYYPAGIPVALVTNIEKNGNSAFSKVFAKSVASVDSFVFALVLQPITPLPPTVSDPVGNRIRTENRKNQNQIKMNKEK